MDWNRLRPNTVVVDKKFMGPALRHDNHIPDLPNDKFDARGNNIAPVWAYGGDEARILMLCAYEAARGKKVILHHSVVDLPTIVNTINHHMQNNIGKRFTVTENDFSID
jgi:hypothetical protein